MGSGVKLISSGLIIDYGLSRGLSGVTFSAISQILVAAPLITVVIIFKHGKVCR